MPNNQLATNLPRGEPVAAPAPPSARTPPATARGPRPGAPGDPWLRSSTVTAARRTAVLSVLIGGIRG